MAAKKAATRKGAPRTAAPRTPAPRTAAPRTAAQIAQTATGPRPLPELDQTGSRRAPSSARVVSDGGLEVVAVRRATSPMVEVRLRIPFGGSGADHAAKAELLAETILLGTSQNDREQIDSRLAAVGAHLTAQVSPQRLLISGAALVSGLDVVLDILAETLTGASYRKDDVARERDKLVEHLAIAGAQPSIIARKHLQRRRFGDHPAVVEMPDPDVVREVSAAKVRGLHHRAVMPEGSTLVLVGDLRAARTAERAASRLASWTGPRPARALATPPEVTAGAVQAFHRPGAVQAQARLSTPGVLRRDPQYAAAHLANIVFGGYFSSRLVENLRENKGFTYHAYSAMESWPGRGAIGIGYDTATDVAAGALVEARYELARIVTTPPADSEVESARQYALGSLASSLANQAGYASTLASLAGSGLDAGWLRDHQKKLRAVTSEEVAAAAQRIFAPAAATGILVGDLDAAGRSLARLDNVEMTHQ